MPISTRSKILLAALLLCLLSLLIFPPPWPLFNSHPPKPRIPNHASQILALTPPPHPNDPILHSPLPNLISHPAADAFYPHLRPENSWYVSGYLPNFYKAWEHNPFVPMSPLLLHRAEVFKHGARVACWPRGGGVWVKRCDLVELDYLGLDRGSNTPRQFEQDVEGEFCLKLKALGGEWWSLPPRFEERREFGWENYAYEQFSCDTLEECFEPEVRAGYFVAWPEEEVVCYVLKREANRRGRGEWIGYWNAGDMDERCRVVLEMGGKWCRGKGRCLELMRLEWGASDPGPLGCGVDRFDGVW